MTTLILGTQSMTRSFILGYALALGKIKASYKKVSHIAERIGTRRAASTLELYGHYDIAQALRDGVKEGK